MPKNILVISYVFPPFPGIGGRRWAKFTKYLTRKGHYVFVICAKNPFKEISTFIGDIQEIPPERIYRLPLRYPSILLTNPHSIFEKIQYSFWVRVLPLFTSGNYYDSAIFWGGQLHKCVNDIMTKSPIEVIIVTSPPFHLAYETIKLKEKFPKVKFVVDYRDEWTFNNLKGFGIISPKRQNIEFQKEKYVCENADVVSSCYETILEYITERYKVKKTFLLPHGYDKDDFTIMETKTQNTNITISHAGTIKEGSHTLFETLSLMLDRMKAEEPSLYDKITFHFYLLEEFKYGDIIRSHSHKFNFQYKVNAREAMARLHASHFALVLITPRYRDYLSTKFPEIFYLRKPIISIGVPGKVSNFIEKSNIGIHISNISDFHKFIYAVKNPFAFSYENFPLEEWDYNNLTDKLIEIL